MGILKSIRFRDKLYMTLKMSKPDTQEYANVLTNLRTYNIILKCCIRTAKKLLSIIINQILNSGIFPEKLKKEICLMVNALSSAIG